MFHVVAGQLTSTQEAKEANAKNAIPQATFEAETSDISPFSAEAEHSQIRRTDTVPLSAAAPNDPDIAALLQDGETFDSIHQMIRTYYFKETRKIERRWQEVRSVDDLTAILKEKQKILHDYQRLKLIEDQLPDYNVPVFTMHILYTVSMTTMGIFTLRWSTVLSVIHIHDVPWRGIHFRMVSRVVTLRRDPIRNRHGSVAHFCQSTADRSSRREPDI